MVEQLLTTPQFLSIAGAPEPGYRTRPTRRVLPGVSRAGSSRFAANEAIVDPRMQHDPGLLYLPHSNFHTRKQSSFSSFIGVFSYAYSLQLRTLALQFPIQNSVLCIACEAKAE